MPFDNGTIPDFFINPVGRAIAALYPLPNRNVPFQNFVSSPILRDDNDSFDARVDHNLNDRAQLTFRYSFGDRDLFEPFTGPSFSLVPGFWRHGETSQSEWHGRVDVVLDAQSGE